MGEIQERFLKFIEYLKMTTAEFEQTVGVGNGFVANTTSRMRNGSKKLISSHYPELNMDWLVNGKGEMLNKSNTINSYGKDSANSSDGNSTQVSGNNSTINNYITEEDNYSEKNPNSIDIIEHQRIVIEKLQRQIDRQQDQIDAIQDVKNKLITMLMKLLDTK